MSAVKGRIIRTAVVILVSTLLLCVFVPGAAQAQIGPLSLPTLMSYNDPGFSDPWGFYSGKPFNSTYPTAYIEGENFTPGTEAYKVAYYDEDGVYLGVDSSLSVGADGILHSEWALDQNPQAKEGCWHSAVYPIGGSIADPYDSTDPDIIVDEELWVDKSAIPEFSTVIAGIAVAGMCFGIYWWMRRRIVSRRQTGTTTCICP